MEGERWDLMVAQVYNLPFTKIKLIDAKRNCLASINFWTFLSNFWELKGK